MGRLKSESEMTEVGANMHWFARDVAAIEASSSAGQAMS